MRPLTTLAVTIAVLAASACAGKPASGPGECHVGIYALADGGLVDVAPTDAGLRWRLWDGRTGALKPAEGGGWTSTEGWTQRPDGVEVAFGDCADGRIRFAGQDGRRLALEVRETVFAGHGGVKLAGRLVMPPGAGPAPVTVLVHGSEDSSARRFYADQRLLPARGIGVFVYDKRGTGGSQGKYTQDFHVLAGDAVAAVAEARRLAGARAARVGLDGGSQGGWIAPLAATLTPVDYVVARYGMAEGPLAEDRAEVLQDVAPFGAEAVAKAAEVADATGKVMASGFRSGFDELDEVRRKYGKEPWFAAAKGDFTGQILPYPAFVLRIAGPFYDKGTSWDYDPMPTLRKVRPPMLWILAAEDTAAPVAETRRRLLALAAEGRPVTVLEFPATDHGIRHFVEADGERKATRYADGYLQAVADFARDGRLGTGDYGTARRLSP